MVYGELAYSLLGFQSRISFSHCAGRLMHAAGVRLQSCTFSLGCVAVTCQAILVASERKIEQEENVIRQAVSCPGYSVLGAMRRSVSNVCRAPEHGGLVPCAAYVVFSSFSKVFERNYDKNAVAGRGVIDPEDRLASVVGCSLSVDGRTSGTPI